jgi:molecular chaperone GrpE (heat shock protein)
MSWFARLLGAPPEPGDAPAEPEPDRLDAAELRGAVERLKAELAAQRNAEGARLAAQREALLADLAGPVAQLLTQVRLEEAGVPLGARDVLTVAARLTRILEDHGLRPEGSPRETEPFDPNRHEVLGGPTPRAGAVVQVKTVGLSYQGRMLRKVGVAADGGTAGD